MADIPVQPKRGVPGWVWLIAALVLLGLLAALLLGVFGDDRDVPLTTGAQATVVAPTAAAGGQAKPTTAGGAVATDVPIGQPDRLVAMVGQDVRLTSVQVQEVVSDKGFWVGPSDTQRLFVLLEENSSPNTKTEGQVDVNKGQTVTIEGEIRRLPSADQAQQVGFDPQRFEELQKEQVYLHAERVQITNS